MKIIFVKLAVLYVRVVKIVLHLIIVYPAIVEHFYYIVPAICNVHLNIIKIILIIIVTLVITHAIHAPEIVQVNVLPVDLL